MTTQQQADELNDLIHEHNQEHGLAYAGAVAGMAFRSTYPDMSFTEFLCILKLAEQRDEQPQ
jgi:hypothetical protein